MQDMSTEIEAKLQVDSHNPVRSALVASGARLLGQAIEHNHLFDDAPRSLLARDCGLRIRSCQIGENRIATMTFKGPRASGMLKQREEIELTVSDAATAGILLQHLGYFEVLSFCKRRESWQYRDCQVELDELPYLGKFVEVEGPDEASIWQVLHALALADQELVSTTYIALLADYCQQHGISPLRIGFEQFG